MKTSTKPTHTPGPWAVAERGYLDQSEPPTYLVTACDGMMTPASVITNKANARLIAAAPELLEKLKAVQEMILETVGTIDARELDRNGVAMLVNDLRSFLGEFGEAGKAIAKAEGL